MIPREQEILLVRNLLKQFPVVALMGARQVGKTTLAKMLASDIPRRNYFDLEHPPDLARLADPMLALEDLDGLVVIDEIQHRPEVFPVLRVLADRKKKGSRFLLLGSAPPDLVQKSAESLAGRIAYLELGGFWVGEVGTEKLDTLWLRGGFPDSFLARTNAESVEWRQQFIRTFLERDLPQLGISLRATTLRRFWTMVAHFHGQLWNSSEFARSFGVADTTVRKYLDVLTDTMVVRQLVPWSENIGKRQVKAPRVYITDSGIAHSLLNISSLLELEQHPKSGASWEGFLVEQVVRFFRARRDEVFFWRTHAGAELDLLIIRGSRRYGFEMKRSVAPSVTSSMRIAINDLSLQKLFVLHAGKESFPLAKNIDAVAAHRLLDDLPATF